MTKLLLILTIFAMLVSAQSGGSIIGTVKDPQGKPVPGTTLTLFSRTGAAGSATTSDSLGSYRFEGLPQGDYLLRAAASGFALFLVEDIHLSTGATETREVALKIAGAHEQVTVTASGTPQLPEQVSKATTSSTRATPTRAMPRLSPMWWRLRLACACNNWADRGPSPPSRSAGFARKTLPYSWMACACETLPPRKRTLRD